MNSLSKLLKDHAVQSATREEVFRELVSGWIVVIASYKSLQDNVFNVQDYIVNDRSYIPLFSDAATARRLLRGVPFTPGMGLNEIKADFLFAAFQGEEWLVVNASDPFSFQMYAHEIKPYLPIVKPSPGTNAPADSSIPHFRH